MTACDRSQPLNDGVCPSRFVREAANCVPYSYLRAWGLHMMCCAAFRLFLMGWQIVRALFHNTGSVCGVEPVLSWLFCGRHLFHGELAAWKGAAQASQCLEWHIVVWQCCGSVVHCQAFKVE